jgi:hypothetical protein
MTNGYSVVSDAQRAQFREEGLCILEGVIDPDTVTMLREECSYFLGYIDAVMDEQGISSIGITHRGSRYFVANRYRISRRMRSFIFGELMADLTRRLLGDEVFFGGIRRYYNEMRFRKAGTDDLIRAFEAESGRSLETFFDRWIHEDDLPDVTFSYRIESGPGGRNAVLRFEQQGKLFEVPITVTLRYRGNVRETLVVPVAGEVTEVRVPLRGQLRDVEVNEDGGALVEVG